MRQSFVIQLSDSASDRLLEYPRWPRFDWMLIIMVSASVYFPALGKYGFRSTEGHRVIPAWTMLDTGDWLTPRLFETPYLRKPPGMQWAVAVSTLMLGRTEFAARAVSAAAATCMALLAWSFASRWFGRRWGIVAGVMQALYPVYWSSARSAEIEALNNLATIATVLLIVQIMIAQRNRRSILTNMANVVALATALSVTALAKGPASGPVIVAAILAGCLVTRSWNVLKHRSLMHAIFLASGALTFITIVLVRHLPTSGEAGVWETDTEGFLWDLHELHRISTLAPVALIYALPTSLALIPVWTWWRHGSRPPSQVDGPLAPMVQWQIAQALALTCVLSLAIFTLLGIHNVRYAQPATTMLAPLMAYVIMRLGATESRWRVLVDRRVLATGTVALVCCAIAFISLYEPRRGRTSGREPALELAASFPDSSSVWAEDMIEARPELLMYAQRFAAADGRHVRPLWKKHALRGLELPPAGTYVLMSDEEHAAYVSQYPDALRDIVRGRVHEYDFILTQCVKNQLPSEVPLTTFTRSRD